MYHDFPLLWKAHLIEGLREDGWPWDFTAISHARDRKIHARLVAKCDGIWCGDGLLTAASDLGKDYGTGLRVTGHISNGLPFTRGQLLAELEGDSQTVLAFERPIVNLAAYFSGVATQTHQLTSIVQRSALKSLPRVTLTRKTMPGYRDLSILAVSVGGGYPHRVSLAGGVLIKENHIAAAGSIPDAIRLARQSTPHLLPVEIEVKNLDEVTQALEENVHAMLLDNFNPDQVKAAIQLIHQSKKSVTVEVSGGITAENIGSYLVEGVQVISTGSMTHSVKSSDFSLLVD